MTPEEYLKASYTALQRSENHVADDIKARLLLLLWRLRQSLLSSLPDTGISREIIIIPLLEAFALELQLYSDAFLAILLRQLEEVDVTHSERAASYAGLRLTRRDYRPRRGNDLLSTTRSGGMTLLEKFTPDPLSTLSPYTTGHLTAIRSKIQAGLMRQDATIEIARSLVAERTTRGYIQPINARGTSYSALRNRDTALISNSVWEVSGYAERKVFERQKYLTTRSTPPAPLPPFGAKGWEWQAILDPKTCPICRPLDGLIRQDFNDFPYIPPVHPRCRCRLLPVQ
jgi:hypothetical protein